MLPYFFIKLIKNWSTSSLKYNLHSSYSLRSRGLKLVSAIFYQFFISHQMIALWKLQKMLFISSTKLFLFLKCSNFCIPIFPSLSLPVQPCFRDWSKTNLKVYNVINCLNKNYSIFRSSHLQMSCNFIKKRLQHKCFPMKFAKLLRTPFLVSQNFSGGWFYILYDCFFILHFRWTDVP